MKQREGDLKQEEHGVCYMPDLRCQIHTHFHFSPMLGHVQNLESLLIDLPNITVELKFKLRFKTKKLTYFH